MEMDINTMCGNIDGNCLNLLKMFVKTKNTMCGNGYCTTIYVLCVETQYFTIFKTRSDIQLTVFPS